MLSVVCSLLLLDWRFLLFVVVGCVLCLLRAVCNLLVAASVCRLMFVVVGGVLFVVCWFLRV